MEKFNSAGDVQRASSVACFALIDSATICDVLVQDTYTTCVRVGARDDVSRTSESLISHGARVRNVIKSPM